MAVKNLEFQKPKHNLDFEHHGLPAAVSPEPVSYDPGNQNIEPSSPAAINIPSCLHGSMKLSASPLQISGS